MLEIKLIGFSETLLEGRTCFENNVLSQPVIVWPEAGNVCFLPVRSSVHPHVRYQSREHDILQTDFAANWHKWSTPEDKGVKCQL